MSGKQKNSFIHIASKELDKFWFWHNTCSIFISSCISFYSQSSVFLLRYIEDKADKYLRELSKSVSFVNWNTVRTYVAREWMRWPDNSNTAIFAERQTDT